ncbi:hypothetical protein DUE52_07790 [Larkinella punicea]|uniref:Uncharacterized protein n=1 Tax=Larkinella punicea TaxID=2315727 RepID=A0A368JRF7_9BACT|nr:hypothetical protein DUE52_07790 [Larkinella punicea]
MCAFDGFRWGKGIIDGYHTSSILFFTDVDGAVFGRMSGKEIGRIKRDIIQAVYITGRVFQHLDHQDPRHWLIDPNLTGLKGTDRLEIRHQFRFLLKKTLCTDVFRPSQKRKRFR